MDIKSVKTTLLKIVEAAGESGITDEKAAKEIIAKYKVSRLEVMNALQEINKTLGAGIALEYDKGVFTYRKPKQPEQPTQKKPEESTAVKLAKKLAQQRTSGDYRTLYQIRKGALITWIIWKTLI